MQAASTRLKVLGAALRARRTAVRSLLVALGLVAAGLAGDRLQAVLEGRPEAPVDQVSLSPAPEVMSRVRPSRPPPPGLRLDAESRGGSVEGEFARRRPSRPPPLGLAAAPDVRALIAIVIDDMGLNRRMGRRAIGLPAPVTLAFLPYARELEEQTAAARRAGHEVILHLPMEPEEGLGDPGPNALLADLDRAELERRLLWNLARIDRYAGVSNHMGSRLMRDREAIDMVMAELKRRRLFFLDSLTVKGSLGWRMARRMGLGTLKRDVFLDNEREADEIRRQLARLEAIAARQGFAVGIGHPHAETLAALAQWLPEARGRGFALVPVSRLIALSREIKVVRGPDEEGFVGESETSPR